MEVTIRVYDPRDAADLADVFFRSVRQVTLSDYTAAQVQAWAPEPRTAEWAHTEASDGRLVLVAVKTLLVYSAARRGASRAAACL